MRGADRSYEKLREAEIRYYEAVFDPKNGGLRDENTHYWDVIFENR
jgi:hypothetical protein